MFLRSCLYEKRDGTKKQEWMIKRRRKSLSFLCRTVIRTYYCKWNRSIWHPSRQKKHGSTLFISNQFINKQSWHVKLLMLTQTRRNRGRGQNWYKLLTSTLTSKKNVSAKINLFTVRFSCLERFSKMRWR